MRSFSREAWSHPLCAKPGERSGTHLPARPRRGGRVALSGWPQGGLDLQAVMVRRTGHLEHSAWRACERAWMEQPPIEHWGVAAELRPLKGGHRNLAFRTVGLRQDLVFKFTRRSGDAMDWLLNVHDLARRAGRFRRCAIRSGSCRRTHHPSEPPSRGCRRTPDALPQIMRKLDVERKGCLHHQHHWQSSVLPVTTA